MIVSNFFKAKKNAFAMQFLTKSRMLSMPMTGPVSEPFRQRPSRRFFGQKLRTDDTMENVEDIFKQMSRVHLAKDVVEMQDELEPRIVS